MKKSGMVWTVIIAVGLLALFLYPKLTDPDRAIVAHWKRIGIDCLPSHQRAALHIHAELAISVDGAPEAIPANTGIVRSCMAETHTHEANNVIHAESVHAGKEFTLGQFLEVYGTPIERPGFMLEMSVNGATSTEREHLTLRDKQKIALTYTRESSDASSE